MPFGILHSNQSPATIVFVVHRTAQRRRNPANSVFCVIFEMQPRPGWSGYVHKISLVVALHFVIVTFRVRERRKNRNPVPVPLRLVWKEEHPSIAPRQPPRRPKIFDFGICEWASPAASF